MNLSDVERTYQVIILVTGGSNVETINLNAIGFKPDFAIVNQIISYDTGSSSTAPTLIWCSLNSNYIGAFFDGSDSAPQTLIKCLNPINELTIRTEYPIAAQENVSGALTIVMTLLKLRDPIKFS